MKRIKTLAPVLLILLTILSAYSLISEATEKNSTYKAHIASARELAQEGIVVDAAKEYDDAIEMKPSIELYLEKGAMFRTNEMNGNATSLGEIIIQKYPKDSRSYDFIIECYMKSENYEDCYDILDTVDKRKITSERIEAARKELRYKYEFVYKSYEDVAEFSGGYCAVKKKDNWGYVSESGSTAIDFVLMSAGAFSDELASITYENEMFYIDSEGNRKKNIPDEIGATEVGAFSDGIAAIKSANSFAYYNDNFKKIAGDFTFAGTFSEKTAAVEENGKWFLINEKGKKINESPYEKIALDENGKAFVNGRAFVMINGKYIMVDENAEQIGNQTFDDAKPFIGSSPAAVKVGNKWGFVDTEGNLVINPEYEEALSFKNGLAAAKNSGKWGYINTDNEVAIGFIFDECKNFNQKGIAFIKDGDTWSIIKLLVKNH